MLQAQKEEAPVTPGLLDVREHGRSSQVLAVTEARFTRARIILRSGLITRGNAATSLRRRINVRAVSIARELLGALLTSRLDAGVQQSLRPLEIVCVQRSRRCAVSCGDCVSPRCQRRDLRQHRRGKPYIGGQSRRQGGRSQDLRGGSPATSDVASAIVEHPHVDGSAIDMLCARHDLEEFFLNHRL